MAIESEVLFIRGNRSDIDTVPKIDGQILIGTDDSGSTDANAIYMDAYQNNVLNRFIIGGTPQSLIDRIEACETLVENCEMTVSTFNSRVVNLEDFMIFN